MFPVHFLFAVLSTISLGEVKDDTPDLKTTLRHLSAFESSDESRRFFMQGEKLFPIYEQILTDKGIGARQKAGVFWVLRGVKADRSRFVDHAIAGLASPEEGIRRAAVHLLAEIGTARDSAPIVALLSDKEWTIAIAAAKTLAAIGDQRALTAMDVWINSSSPRKDRNERFDEVFRQDIAKYRDELKARLAKEKPPSK